MLPKVMADRVQLQQVFMNLMLNGIDAMKNLNGTGEPIIKSQQTGKDQLLISVSDTGVGLPAERADQIFEAFFTTKPQALPWGYRLAAPSSSRMAAVCGLPPTPGRVHAFSLFCRPRLGAGRSSGNAPPRFIINNQELQVGYRDASTLIEPAREKRMWCIMEFRQLGHSGLRVPALGFGTSTSGGGANLFQLGATVSSLELLVL